MKRDTACAALSGSLPGILALMRIYLSSYSLPCVTYICVCYGISSAIFQADEFTSVTVSHAITMDVEYLYELSVLAELAPFESAA